MRGRGFRMIHAAPVILALLPSLALGSPERHIPRGELNPQVIEKVFDSPRGEVQFTVVERTSTHGAYLRNVKGHLMGFTEVRGGRDCEQWYLSAKVGAVPLGCEFLFYDEVDGRYMSVRSEEMEESSIFGVASGEIQSLEGRTE